MLHAKKFLSPLHAGVQLPPVSALQFVGSTTTAVTKSGSKCDQAGYQAACGGVKKTAQSAP